MRTREKILGYGGGGIAFVAAVITLTAWAGMMGCAIRTGDGAVCIAVAQAVVHKDTPASRAIVTTYLNTDWLGRPIVR